MGVWEPLLEPLEDESKDSFRPWSLELKVVAAVQSVLWCCDPSMIPFLRGRVETDFTSWGTINFNLPKEATVTQANETKGSFLHITNVDPPLYAIERV